MSVSSINTGNDSITVSSNTLSVVKGNLTTNNTYLVWISARTTVGMGPKSTILTVKIGEHF